jgi:hypothetical protein
MTEAMCKCLDCQSNDQQGNCVAPQIQLDYAQDGSCQCLSYQPAQQAQSMPQDTGLGAALGPMN